MKELAIVIVNYNDYERTKKCVDNMLKIGINARLIIVDNDSLNKSYDILYKYYQCREDVSVINTKKNLGYAAGNNAGFRYIEKKFPDVKYLCVMNPDVIVEENYFTELCQYLEISEKYVAITCMMSDGEKIDFSNITWNIPTEKEIYADHVIWKRYNNKKLKACKLEGQGLLETEVLPGSFFIIKQKEFSEMQYFDEGTFLYNEENILAIRLRNSGYKCLLCTKYHYLHLHKKSPRKKVYEKYIYDFRKILEEESIRFNSRKYLCKNYYNGKYLMRLYLVNFMNVGLMYVKRQFVFLKVKILNIMFTN